MNPEGKLHHNNFFTMKPIKIILLINLLLMMSYAGYSQKETYDVVSYSLPKGWQQQQNDGGIQLSVSDNKTGAYAVAVITKAMVSDKSANGNFNSQWTTLVKSTVNVKSEPTMQEPASDNGWNIVSGNANYTDGANRGLATLLCATGYGQTVSVVLMTNTQLYQNELLEFINSLKLSKSSQSNISNSNAAASGNANPSSIVGLWCDYHPKEYSGYIRTEYAFYSDGSYLYRTKQWTILQKEILFIYESGTWTVKGNQLTISPSQGKGEYWSKSASGSSKEWGSKVKSTTLKLEKTSFTFAVKYVELVKEMNLLLTKANESNAASYYLRNLNESLIDNPPGLKTGFENKSLASGTKSPSNLSSASIAVNSPITGKIWEGTTSEKFITGSLNGHYTGGFFKWQYRFNTDGTYRFVYVGASAYAEPNQLQYETGTYSISGNQLTITPVQGANEEWSVVGGPIRLSGMSDVQIRNIKEHWGKKIKVEKRKLEKVTYTFKVEYQEGNHANAMIVEYNNGHTEREGNGKIAYYFETTADKSVKLPIDIK